MRSVDDSGGKSELEIELKYFDGEPVIREIKRVSTPGRRVYSSVEGPAAASPTGSASPYSRRRRASCRIADARTENVGGEVLCSVF